MQNKDNFWTDELVKELLALYWDKPVADVSKTLDIQIERFKESKEIKEKERIEISPITEVYSDPKNVRYAVISTVPFITKKWPYSYDFFTIEKLTSKQLFLIKQAIEKCLNDEQPKEIYGWNDKTGILTFPQPPSGEFITKEECERIERAAFEAGGKVYGVSAYKSNSPIYVKNEYPTFEDYKKQSLKQ